MAQHDSDILKRLLDYRLGLDESAQHDETARLLSENTSVREMDAAVQRTLGALAAWGDEEPPMGLSERTLSFIHEQQRGQR